MAVLSKKSDANSQSNHIDSRHLDSNPESYLNQMVIVFSSGAT